MRSSILRQIWLNFIALWFLSALSQFPHVFRISDFFNLSITDETWLIEMRIWCIKFCVVLILHWNLICIGEFICQNSPIYYMPCLWAQLYGKIVILAILYISNQDELQQTLSEIRIIHRQTFEIHCDTRGTSVIWLTATCN
jgi:hypothetical protein